MRAISLTTANLLVFGQIDFEKSSSQMEEEGKEKIRGCFLESSASSGLLGKG